MPYEYHVIPAPSKGQKVKGAKSADARYAAALATALNTEAAQGWEFIRAEVLPTEERQGLTGSKTVFVNVLVFRRDADETAVQIADEPPRMIEHESSEGML